MVPEPATESSSHSSRDEISRLRAELSFYRQLVDGNRDGLWHSDLNTGRLWVSDRWWEMLGYQPEDVPKSFDGFRRLVHSEDLPGVETALRRHLSGEEEEYRCQYRLKDGRNVWRTVLSRGRADRLG